MTTDKKVLDAIFERIEASDSIVIFGHVNPDGDCVGSVMGLRNELRVRFPEKTILCVGTHPAYLGRWIEPSDEVSDETIADSLAVMVDLSDFDRVEDQRIRMAKEVVCIDHHVAKPEGYPFLNYREEEAPSATYILAKALIARYGSLGQKTASYLYLGLVTDSGRFQFDANPDTLRTAADIISYGVDFHAIYNDLYRQSSRDLKYRAYIYGHYQFDGKVCYCIIPREAYEALGMTDGEAGGKVNLLALVDDHPIWVVFLEQQNGLIRVEFRGNGHYNVQTVATKFGGGGHFSASGARLENFGRVQEVLDACNLIPEE